MTDSKTDAVPGMKKIPPHVALRFAERGVDVEKFVWTAYGDMDDSHNYADCWMGFDSEKVYKLIGTEQTERVRGAEKFRRTFRVRLFETYDCSVLGKLEVERMIATARLIAKEVLAGDNDKNKELKLVRDERDFTKAKTQRRVIEIASFSLGRCVSFENFAKHFNQVFLPDNDDDPPVVEYEMYCPKCGLRYPDSNRRICPKCTKHHGTVARLLQLFGRYKRNVFIILTFMMFNSLIGMLSPYIGSKVFYDNVLTGNIWYFFGRKIDVAGQVGLFVGIIVTAWLLQLGIQTVYNYFLTGLVPKVVYDMKMMVFSAMQRLSVSFYTSKQTGSLMYRVSGDANYIYWFFVDGIPFIFTNAITFLGVLIFMFLLNAKLTLFIIIAVPLIALFYYLILKTFPRLYHSRWIYHSRMQSLLSDALYGQRIIKAFSKEDQENERFGDYSEQVKSSDTVLADRQVTYFPLVSIMMIIVQCIILGWGSVMIVNGEMGMGLGTIMAFSSYTGMLYSPLVNLSSVVNWWAGCLDASQRIFEIVDARSDVPEADSPIRMENPDGRFEAEDVFFEYETGRPVIRNLNLSIDAGQMLGIVGKTGSGKSTLVNLLARLYDPKSGKISLDGTSVKDIAIADLRKNIGIVSQDIYLFIGSIADNIRYAKPEATMAEVIAAAKAASAHDFIIKLPDGYETYIGAGGKGLSGGERQRLSIARAVIQNPKILILDEATAAMDTETERNIQASLSKLGEGRTVISIAHRLSTLRDADVLAVVDKGRVTEYGTHDELLALKGVYYRLYTLQMEALKFIGIGE